MPDDDGQLDPLVELAAAGWQRVEARSRPVFPARNPSPLLPACLRERMSTGLKPLPLLNPDSSEPLLPLVRLDACCLIDAVHAGQHPVTMCFQLCFSISFQLWSAAHARMHRVSNPSVSALFAERDPLRGSSFHA